MQLGENHEKQNIFSNFIINSTFSFTDFDLSFQSGYSPKYTKNNGIFFNEYFDVTKLNLIDDEESLKFEDGKWIFATYASSGAELGDALYLMRQINVALNRDINKLKRVIFSQD